MSPLDTKRHCSIYGIGAETYNIDAETKNRCRNPLNLIFLSLHHTLKSTQ